MPKILEATLAEHRARLRALLVDTAHQLLLEGGYPALTFSKLAERADLARPTIYSYFSSRDELAVAVCEQALPEWLQTVQNAMTHADGPRAQVTAYLRSQLELAATGRHRLAQTLAVAPLSAETRSAIRAIHDRFSPGLTGVLADMGVRQPALTANLVQGVVNAGLQRITAGDDPEEVMEGAVALVLLGVLGKPVDD